MTLQPNALLTVEEGLAYLNTGDGDAAMVEDLINRVSDYCESGSVGTNRPLVKKTVDVRYPSQDPVRPRLLLAAWPIDLTQTIEVTLDGNVLTVWRSEADGNPSGFNVVVGATDPGTPDHLYRAGGWSGSTPYPIRVIYTGGFEQSAVPGDLKQAAFDILEHFWRAQVKRLTDVQSVSGTSASPSVGFTPSLIPMRARQVLDAYRVAR